MASNRISKRLVPSRIGKQTFGLVHGAQERNGHGYVGDVAGRQGEGDRSATIIGQSMDFRPIASAYSPFLSQRPSGAL
jgi:hypothetical protein